MAKYTVELRNVMREYGEEEVKNWFKSYELADYLTDEEIKVINDRGTWSKEKLATLIIEHYFMREIGFETPALFRHYAKVTMKEIMEKKLPLIYSASIKYDPLVNVDYTETYTRQVKDNGTIDSSSNSNATGLTVNSDTPQKQISKDEILAGKYASNTQAGDSTAENSNFTENNSESNEESSKKVKGNSGVSATAQRMIVQYRENIVSINKDIIDELDILFMGLF